MRRLEAYALSLPPLHLPQIHTHPTPIKPSSSKEQLQPVEHNANLRNQALDAQKRLRAQAHEHEKWALTSLNEEYDKLVHVADAAHALAESLHRIEQASAATRAEVAPTLAAFEEEQLRHRTELAARTAAEARSRPLREARSAASVALEPAAAAAAAARPHSAAHPLVRALAAIDCAVASLAHGSAERDEMLALRGRAMQLVASLHVIRPLAVLTAQLTSSSQAQAALGAATTTEAPSNKATTAAPAEVAAAAGPAATASASVAEEAAAATGSALAPGDPPSVRDGAVAAASSEVRFASLAARLRPWVAELEVRWSSDDRDGGSANAALLAARSEFWEARRRFVSASLGGVLAVICQADDVDAAHVFRRCCGHVLRSCKAEARLYGSLFSPEADKIAPAADPASSSVDAMEALFFPLYSVLRPVLLRTLEVDPLCAVIRVLQDEVSKDVSRAGWAGFALERIAANLLGDARERLAFRVQAFVQGRIRGRARSPRAGGHSREGARFSQHPAIAEGLDCLAKVYRCLPRDVFKGLSQEILTECTGAAVQASDEIGTEVGRHARARAQLYLLSQLLTVREQIGAFDSDFAVTKKALDFTHTRDAIRAFVGRRGGVSTVMELLQRSVPCTVESQVDAKCKLEHELRRAAEGFIRDTSSACTKPLLALLRGAGGAQDSSAELASLSREAIEDSIKATEAALREVLAPACELARSAFQEPSTHAILFAPIKTAIVDALGQVQTLLNAAAAHADLISRFTAMGASVDAAMAAPAPTAAVHEEAASDVPRLESMQAAPAPTAS